MLRPGMMRPEAIAAVASHKWTSGLGKRFAIGLVSAINLTGADAYGMTMFLLGMDLEFYLLEHRIVDLERKVDVPVGKEDNSGRTRESSIYTLTCETHIPGECDGTGPACVTRTIEWVRRTKC